MIANTFKVLGKVLNDYFSQEQNLVPQADIVDFLEQQGQEEVIEFPLNKVIPIFINAEQENQLRPADRFARNTAGGQRENINPNICLNLYVLFVCNFQYYTDSLYYVDHILRYFQSHPVLNHENTPSLDEEIVQLIPELLTLPFSEQNEVWNSLRSAYRPSLLYKVKMLVYQDQSALPQAPEITVVQSEIKDINQKNNS